VVFTVALRDPDSAVSVGLVVIGSSLAVAALAGLAFVSISTRGTRRGARRGIAVARGLRRGVMVGCVTALVALLRVVDGLTPLTAVFVIAPFIVAEVVLSTRRA
jgi:threonine/homoserine/homoserine lactone efflux protein